MSKIIISVEGNIGVGKSTFVKLLQKHLDGDIVEEPVNIWTSLIDENNKNILQLFYDDKKRYGYTFQNLAYITRIMTVEEKIKTTNKNIIILDRSIETDKNVFEKMLYQENIINEIEHKMYNLWYDFYDNHVNNKNNKKIIIYLKNSTDISIQRIKKRNRTEENNIDINYLNLLKQYHDEWLNVDNSIILDCDIDFENNTEYLNEMFKKIENKLSSLN